jgi:hypothetical protein
MTITRGFVLSTFFAALLMLLAMHRWRQVGVALAVGACVAFFLWVYLPSQDDTLEGKRETSNTQRVEDFQYIVDNLEVGAIPLGHGLGSLVNDRLNIENTFLWAFWRLGLAGLLFWAMPLVVSMVYFGRIRRRDPHFRLACAYFFSIVLIYVQTMTNPYLNNPIGLSFVLVALFSLRTISRGMPALEPPPERRRRRRLRAEASPA